MLPRALWLEIIRLNKGRCVACGRPARQVDHIRPQAAGGTSGRGNLAPLCEECNRIKSNWYPGVKYRPFMGYGDIAAARRIWEAEVEWLCNSDELQACDYLSDESLTRRIGLWSTSTWQPG